MKNERRRWLVSAASLGMGLVLVPSAARARKPPEKEEEEVSPVEDLMREHGVLRRVLFVYEEVLHRLDAPQTIPAEVLPTAAGMVRRFVEDYHEKLEEEHVFPRFEKADRLVELVAVLRTQHQRGRALTDQVLRLGAPAQLSNEPARRQLGEVLRKFIRMYGPHAAREDTVLFPAFHGLVGDKLYRALGEQFEDKEHALFGEAGFEKMVDEVANLERALDVHDLSLFTPKP